VERRHLIRLLVLVGVLAAATAAAAATGVKWGVLFTGTTTPSGKQAPVGYVAVTRAQERPWRARLTPSDRAALARLNLVSTGAVAVFLDGLACASHVTTTSVTRSGSTLTARFAFTRPPIGVAMCVRTSTPYVVLSVSRKSLGRPAPTHVDVIARART
jgi:hypothetical protein